MYLYLQLRDSSRGAPKTDDGHIIYFTLRKTGDVSKVELMSALT